VRLRDEANEKAWSWRIENAFPVKWSSVDMDAQSSVVLIESLELAHHGFRVGA
jgi:phage tail-like protein